MKKRITVTLEVNWETDDDWLEPGQDFKTLDDIRGVDYDNIDRPLNHMADLDWVIVDSNVEDIN